MVLPQLIDINEAHGYSHLGNKLLHITYDALGVKLIVAIKVCGLFARSKAKAPSVIKKRYTRDKNPGENIFVDTTGPFPEIIIGNCYFNGALDEYTPVIPGDFLQRQNHSIYTTRYAS